MDEPSKPEVGIIKQGRVKRLLKPTKKNLLLFVVIGFVLIAGVTVFLLINKKDTSNQLSDDKNSPIYGVSNNEYALRAAEGLSKAPPSENASMDEKNEYYNRLISYEFELGHFDKVIAAYEKLASIRKEKSLSFNTYIAAAQSYIKLNDKQTAVKLLDQAEQSVRKTVADPESQQDFLDVINMVRKEAQI